MQAGLNGEPALDWEEAHFDTYTRAYLAAIGRQDHIVANGEHTDVAQAAFDDAEAMMEKAGILGTDGQAGQITLGKVLSYVPRTASEVATVPSRSLVIRRRIAIGTLVTLCMASGTAALHFAKELWGSGHDVFKSQVPYWVRYDLDVVPYDIMQASEGLPAGDGWQSPNGVFHARLPIRTGGHLSGILVDPNLPDGQEAPVKEFGVAQTAGMNDSFQVRFIRDKDGRWTASCSDRTGNEVEEFGEEFVSVNGGPLRQSPAAAARVIADLLGKSSGVADTKGWYYPTEILAGTARALEHGYDNTTLPNPVPDICPSAISAAQG